jgi:hypothetical protein
MRFLHSSWATLVLRCSIACAQNSVNLAPYTRSRELTAPRRQSEPTRRNRAHTWAVKLRRIFESDG